MHAWLEATLAKLSCKSDTAAAIRYALSRWPARTRYIDDGQLEIDTTPPNAPCASLPWVARTISSPDQTPEENVPPPSTRCSARPSSTASTRRSTSTKSSNESLTTRSAGSRNCCHGTSHRRAVQSLLNVCIHITLCGYTTLTPTHKNGPDHTLTLL